MGSMKITCKNDIRKNIKTNQNHSDDSVLLMTITARFRHSKDGRTRLFANSPTFSYENWDRYMSAYGNIKLVVRSKIKDSDNDKYIYEVTGPQLEVSLLPYFEGPWQFAFKFPAIKKVKRNNEG